jgi:F-type H+-transporting ATPase subunit b
VRVILVLLVYTVLAFLRWIPDWLDPWLNYPGLELWKFINLLIFILCALYLHRRFGRPIRKALNARAEGIKRELARAREDRDQALAKLAEVEVRLADLDAEVARIKEKARIEAAAEKERITLAAEQEIARMREQAKREIDSAGKAARHDLRRFAARESVRLAEDILQREISAADDARLTNLNVQELGGTRA